MILQLQLTWRVDPFRPKQDKTSMGDQHRRLRDDASYGIRACPFFYSPSPISASLRLDGRRDVYKKLTRGSSRTSASETSPHHSSKVLCEEMRPKTEARANFENSSKLIAPSPLKSMVWNSFFTWRPKQLGNATIFGRFCYIVCSFHYFFFKSSC